MSVNSYLTDLSIALVLSSSENPSISTSISTLSARINIYFSSDIQSIPGYSQSDNLSFFTEDQWQPENESSVVIH